MNRQSAPQTDPKQKAIIAEQERANRRIINAATRKELEAELEIVDVKITNIENIPPHYFIRPEVIEAIRLHVRADVVSRGKPMPPGAQPIWAQKGTTAAAWARLGVAQQDLSRSIIKVIKDNLALIVVLYGVLLLGVLIWAILKGGN